MDDRAWRADHSTRVAVAGFEDTGDIGDVASEGELAIADEEEPAIAVPTSKYPPKIWRSAARRGTAVPMINRTNVISLFMGNLLRESNSWGPADLQESSRRNCSEAEEPECDQDNQWQ